MKLLAIAAVLVGLAVADSLETTACPTVTKQLINPVCNKVCDTGDCRLVSTIHNPCNCPTAIPTASLLAPCDADCPYNGCDIVFRTSKDPCPTTTSTTTRRTRTTRTPTPTTTSTSTTSSTSTSTSTTRWTISTGVTTLPPRPTTTPCPTVTLHTQPSDCKPLRCPVPTCVQRETMVVPCGCAGPKTVLYVEGCSSVCPDGCQTRTSTVSVACATP